MSENLQELHAEGKISQGIEIVEHMGHLQEQWHTFWEELSVYLIGRLNKVKSSITSLWKNKEFELYAMEPVFWFSSMNVESNRTIYRWHRDNAQWQNLPRSSTQPCTSLSIVVFVILVNHSNSLKFLYKISVYISMFLWL